MRKFIKVFFALLIFSVAFAKAENPALKQDKFTDETFVGITIGWDSDLHKGDWVGMNSGLRIGKWFTPQVGTEIEGTAQFREYYKRFLYHRVGVNVLVNLNYLNGYKGIRNDVEFVPFVGVGWQRNYDVIANNMYTKMGMQFNFNLSKSWQFNVIPSVAYVLTPELQYNVHKMDFGIVLGATYNFKNSHGTHFFKVCDYKYSQAEMDSVNSKVNQLLKENNRLITEFRERAQAREKVKVINNIIKAKEIITKPIFATIGFEKASSNILPVYDLNIKTIAECIKESKGTFTIIGFASEEGNAEYNLKLSQERAQSVADALIKYGVDATKLSVEGKGATSEFGTGLDFNRTVQIIEK